MDKKPKRSLEEVQQATLDYLDRWHKRKGLPWPPNCEVPCGDTKMDGCQTIPGASAEYTSMHGEGQRYGRCEDY